MPVHPRARGRSYRTLVRGFEHVGDLPRDGEGCVDRNRTLCDAIRERRSLNQFHPAHANLRSNLIRAEAGTGSDRQTAVIIWGCRCRQGILQVGLVLVCDSPAFPISNRDGMR